MSDRGPIHGQPTTALRPKPIERSVRRGLRLSKLEVFNWGTFDRVVHSFEPRGESSLLVGENGTGKSTLVDAMLTLLVRPGVRNYNVAAGAQKKERDERTYMRGAYDRTAGEDDKSKIQSLREGNQFYTALLATFASETSGRVFTICQVMYLTSSGDKHIFYGFDDKERGIVTDLSGLPSGSEIKSLMIERGFRVTENYKQYLSWVQKITGLRPKAMDVFNQTVAVKDVHRLDEFIREHMLEKKPWNDKVSGLLKHFAELSEAHRALVRVKEQNDLLQPVLKHGATYKRFAEKLESTRRQQAASPLFFDVAFEQLLTPLCEQWQVQLKQLGEAVHATDSLLESKRTDAAQLKNDIANAGGSRLQQLPMLIQLEGEAAATKRSKRTEWESRLSATGLRVRLTSNELLTAAQTQAAALSEQLESQRKSAQDQLSDKQYELGTLQRELQVDRSEWESLRERRGNLPHSFIHVRDELCRALRLAPSDLPFVAELVAVLPEHRTWEASIEQVLHGFARTLLVPDHVYAKVSGYIDGVRLTDAGGRGQRLTYDRVGQSVENNQALPKGIALPLMLQYRPDHPLVPYVRGEVHRRFDHIACESVDQFQRESGRAMTINRHTKQNHFQHAKDDRGKDSDRRDFVLGWDNKTKRVALETTIKATELAIRSIDEEVQTLRRSGDHATRCLDLLSEFSKLSHFDSIDDQRHDFAASQLRMEKQKLEQSNDRIQALQQQLAAVNAEIEGLMRDSNDLNKRQWEIEKELKNGSQVRQRASANVLQAKADGSLELHQRAFVELQQHLAGREILFEAIGTLPAAVDRELATKWLSIEKQLEPAREELTGAMTRLISKFPELAAEFDVSPKSLPGLEQLAQRIAKDDLPRYVNRFKQRLNNHVLQEVGLLHGSLETEREEIRAKIELLNDSLHRLDWRKDTYMRLEPSDTGDEEIRKFRRDLTACLEGTLEGSDDANEATFKRIEELVNRLRDDANLRWREKVIDVRNWFKFKAQEYDRVTGKAGSTYEGGTGQSGGEKGKLAFLVLVAAIAYQYDLRPEEPEVDRFHFVMVDEMFSRSDDTRAKYALDLFNHFGLQLAIVAPLDAKARVVEEYVGMYCHIVKDSETHRSELISLTAEQYQAIQASEAS